MGGHAHRRSEALANPTRTRLTCTEGLIPTTTLNLRTVESAAPPSDSGRNAIPCNANAVVRPEETN